jgi:hypothetical protein
MNTKTKILIISMFFAVASVFAQAASGQDASERLAKLSARLKQLDSNGNGMIDADEASTGVGKVLIDRYYPNGPPQYPIAVAEVMRVAEAQIRGGTAAGAATSTPSGTAPTQTQKSASPTPAAPGASASAPPASGGAAPPGGASVPPAGTTPAPQSGVVSATPAASSPPSGQSASSGISSPQAMPQHKSGKIPTAKERLQFRGLPDWFLKKIDSAGQITMAEFTDAWTTEKVTEFEKYDLNHDGIITADEVLKVEGHHSGK